MKTDNSAMCYEEVRLRLWRLSSISPTATAEVGRFIENQLVQLGASAANLSDEENECCARTGLKAETLAAHKAKEAAVTKAGRGGR